MPFQMSKLVLIIWKNSGGTEMLFLRLIHHQKYINVKVINIVAKIQASISM
jgi:hypothetical protein